MTSAMTPGYGFAALRDGERVPGQDTQRDFWLYYGRSSGHGHLDSLNLGLHAFGLDMAPDSGYPEQTGEQPNRMQWVRNTISHNTVTVNAKGQNQNYGGAPLHFDDTDAVKLMDVDYSQAYEETEICTQKPCDGQGGRHGELRCGFLPRQGR